MSKILPWSAIKDALDDWRAARIKAFKDFVDQINEIRKEVKETEDKIESESN